MVKWTQDQKDAIWRLYSIKQMTFSQIAERYKERRASPKQIEDIINEHHRLRNQVVEDELEQAAKNMKSKPHLHNIVKMHTKTPGHRNGKPK